MNRNNTNGTSSSMGHESIMAHSSNNNAYSGETWTSMSPYSQSPYSTSPLTDYGSFAPYVSHGMPVESTNRMPPPPPHQMISRQPSMGHHHHHHHPPLPMLNTTWPSQLTNPTPSGSYSAPPLSVIIPASGAPPVEAPRLPTPHEKARKTLSTEQKRAMCQFHEDNPGTRQADIGARFGVERSTVSKVLRQKDQYLKREPDSEQVTAAAAAAAAASGIKRVKGKYPDFDRTLSNYVRRQQQRGFEVKDEEIMEQAKLFAHAAGNQDGLLNTLTTNWLQKFKQKHGIGAGKLMRRASEANIPDSARMSTLSTKSNGNTNGIISPTPSGQVSPLSGCRSDEELPIHQLNFEGFGYKHEASNSTASLASDFRDTANSSFSGTMSPTAPFTFSPDPNVGGFQVDQHLQLRSNGPDMLHREKRSNTFPSLNLEGVTQTSSATEPLTPRHGPSATAPCSALDSPAHELQAVPYAVDTNITSPPRTLHRSSSNSSINARSSSTPVVSSAVSSTPVDSSPISPSQEEARRAAATLLNYLQNSGHFDNTEYMTVVQLTKKLQIHQHQTSRAAIGGLSRIPEGEVDLPTMIEPAMETV